MEYIYVSNGKQWSSYGIDIEAVLVPTLFGLLFPDYLDTELAFPHWVNQEGLR